MKEHHVERWKIDDRIINDEVTYVVTSLAQVRDELSKAKVIGIDAQHFHRRDLCILQVATQGMCFVIDCLALQDLSPLNYVMEDPDIIKVGHSFFQNKKDKLPFRFAGVRDTQVLHRHMRNQPYARLADLQRIYGVIREDQEDREDPYIRNANWAVRPLSNAVLNKVGKSAQDLIRLFAAMEPRCPDEIWNTFEVECERLCTSKMLPFEPQALGTERNNKYKTKLCINWERSGLCTHGANCAFAHGPEELRSGPASRSYPKARSTTTTTYGHGRSDAVQLGLRPVSHPRR
jgi:hypothetical protein